MADSRIGLWTSDGHKVGYFVFYGITPIKYPRQIHSMEILYSLGAKWDVALNSRYCNSKHSVVEALFREITGNPTSDCIPIEMSC